jgi:2-hydroxy-3-oxopropionate reductase
MEIAFIGLGIMGLPMATNLLTAGHSVRGYNRSPERTQLLVEAGGTAAASIAEAVAGAEVVITVLPDSPDVEAVVAGPDGVLASVEPGTLIVDMSSISPEVARRLSAQAAEQGVEMLDAPVSGGEQGAKDGSLSIMVGGEVGALERAKPLLDAMGGTIVHVGGAGAGQTVKAANQLLVAGTIELVSEALVFLDASGVDLEPAVAVLAGGLAGNAILNRKAAGMLAGTFAPGFRIELHHKDLGIYTSAARAAGVFSPMGAVAAQLMGAMTAKGRGGLDHTALLQQVDEFSGRDRWAGR